LTSVSFTSIVKRENLLLPILRPHINIQKIRKKKENQKNKNTNKEIQNKLKKIY
jgi:hypothetical protein